MASNQQREAENWSPPCVSMVTGRFLKRKPQRVQFNRVNVWKMIQYKIVTSLQCLQPSQRLILNTMKFIFCRLLLSTRLGYLSDLKYKTFIYLLPFILKGESLFLDRFRHLWDNTYNLTRKTGGLWIRICVRLHAKKLNWWIHMRGCE